MTTVTEKRKAARAEWERALNAALAGEKCVVLQTSTAIHKSGYAQAREIAVRRLEDLGLWVECVHGRDIRLSSGQVFTIGRLGGLKHLKAETPETLKRDHMLRMRAAAEACRTCPECHTRDVQKREVCKWCLAFRDMTVPMVPVESDSEANVEYLI